jgi:hypothetical protein
MAVVAASALSSSGVAGLMLGPMLFVTSLDMLEEEPEDFMMAGTVAFLDLIEEEEELHEFEAMSSATSLLMEDPIVMEYCLDSDTVVEYYGEPAGSGSSAYCAIRTMHYDCEYGCKNGACVPHPTGNKKRMESYPEGVAFMISSDASWQTILSYVPVAVWSKGVEIDTSGDFSHRYMYQKKYPYLIYGNDRGDLDVDSTVHFIQQYKPEQIYFLHPPEPDVSAILTMDNGTPRDTIRANPSLYMGAGMDADQLAYVPKSEYFSFWENISTFVVCENDYETGLICAEFAALLNAPLIFDGVATHWSFVSSKNAIVIGDISSGTRDMLNRGNRIIAEYTMAEAQAEYAEITGTDKVILVNPDDLEIDINFELRPKRIAGSYHDLYTMDSLAAPYLAAAKREVIITTTDRNYDHIDDHIESEMDRLNIDGKPGEPPYLTIVSSPSAIPMARYDPFYANAKISNDTVVYLDMPEGDIDVYVYDLATGTKTKMSTDDANEDHPAIYGDMVMWTTRYQEHTNPGWNTDVMRKEIGSTMSLVFGDGGKEQWPGVYENQYTWEDWDGGGWATIYACDLDLPTNHVGGCSGTGPNPMSDPNTGREPAINGNHVVWTDKRNEVDGDKNYDIWFGNFRGQFRQQVTSSTYKDEKPQIYGDIIVWQRYHPVGRSWQLDIFMCNLSLDGSDGGCMANDTKTQISTGSGNKRYPSIWGDTVVWNQYTKSGLDWAIKAYNLSSGSTDEIYRSAPGMKATTAPYIQGNRVVFTAPTNTTRGIRRHVKVYDLESDSFIASIPTLVSGGECNAGRNWLELDTRYYGTTGWDMGIQDIGVGRISGITVSDTSSYINRALFQRNLTREQNAMVIVREHWDDGFSSEDGKDEEFLNDYARRTFWTSDIESKFDDVYFVSGHAGVDAPNPNNTHIQNHYQDSYLIVYDDHGWTEGFSDAMSTTNLRDNNRWMYPSTVFSIACSTCDYNRANKVDLFCANNLRYGALQFHGATGMGYWHVQFEPLIRGTFVEGKTIGHAFMEAKNAQYVKDEGRDYATWIAGYGESVQVMWGDPTLRPKYWFD